MKKGYKKITSLIITGILSTTLLNNNILTTVQASEKDNYTNIENKEALKIYENLNSQKKTKTVNFNYSDNENNEYLKNEFKELNLITNTTNENTETIYSGGNEQIQSVIAYNEDTNVYILLEANTITNEIILIVDGEEYKIIQEGENVNLYSQDGKVLPLIITEYEDTPLVEYNKDSSIFESNLTRTSFGKEYGPFKKTNKVMIEVIGPTSAIGGVIALKIKHPLLGIVSTIAGAITVIADKSYATLYIMYYQSYATNDSTYVKQRENFYNYNNYTSFIKSRTWYFYTSRP